MASIASTPYTLKSGKIVQVPNSEIEKNMKFLKLTRSEAVQLYLEDNGYIENAEQVALDEKASKVKIKHEARKAEYKPKTQKERVQKEDPTKEGIISAMAELLTTLDATDIVIANKGKLITFALGADTYKLNLSRDRVKKDKGE